MARVNHDKQKGLGAPKVRDWVRRLVEAQELDLGEKGLGWWSYHLEGFLQYCRDRGERIEARILGRVWEIDQAIAGL
jgi:hypothetical protein